MLKIGEQRGIAMRFISNGSLCNEKIAEQLATLKNTEITFSIDGATAEVFEKVRVGSQFAQVIKNIRNLVQICNFSAHTLGDRQQKSMISTWTVVNHDNIDEVPKIVELASEIGVDQVTLQSFVSNWGKEEMDKHTSAIQVDANSNKFKNNIEEAKQIAEQKSIDLTINESNFFSQEKPCSWPWKSAYIASNGDVIPCCVLADSDIVKMGNVFEQDFAEIWNSEDYQNFREKIKTHNLPNYCKGCYLK
jgi:radical SAM protein with 4Fe4S-binding SPASM domain